MKIFKIVTDFDSNIFKKYLLSVFIINVSCVIYFAFSQYFSDDIPIFIQEIYPKYLLHSVQLQHHLTQFFSFYLGTFLSTVIMWAKYRGKSIFTLKYFFFILSIGFITHFVAWWIFMPYTDEHYYIHEESLILIYIWILVVFLTFILGFIRIVFVKKLKLISILNNIFSFFIVLHVLSISYYFVWLVKMQLY